MQVSSVSTNRFSASKILERMIDCKSGIKVESASGSFTSSLKNIDEKSESESIYEWKNFCEEQIMSNNIDYIA